MNGASQLGSLSETAVASPSRERLRALDLVRGAVMVLMALDHVRVFISGATFDPTDLTQTTWPLFLTRWVTHFCAPAFVFLAGTGAFLRGGRAAGRQGLSRFLLTRGAWLILIELTVVRLGWTFNFDYAHYALAGVIWVIGWSMILLSGLVYLPVAAVGAVGLAIVLGHNLLDALLPSVMPEIQQSGLRWIWQITYLGGGIELWQGGPVLAVLYSIIPWVGVMASGYAFGAVMQMPPARRRTMCLRIGLGAVALFLVLRGFNLYGDARPWSPQSSPGFTVLSFLNTRKYPASLLFLLMTLGPTIALLPLLERARGRVADWLSVFGRVPFLYYVLHIPLIHLAALLLSSQRYGEAIPWLFQNHPVAVPPPPEGYGYGLPMVYLVTLVVVTILYRPCRWFAGVKARRRDPWLSFL